MIFHISANEGETGYLVVANTAEEAKSEVRKYYKKINDASVGKLEFEEKIALWKGVFAVIDWTEPEPPLFNI